MAIDTEEKLFELPFTISKLSKDFPNIRTSQKKIIEMAEKAIQEKNYKEAVFFYARVQKTVSQNSERDAFQRNIERVLEAEEHEKTVKQKKMAEIAKSASKHPKEHAQADQETALQGETEQSQQGAETTDKSSEIPSDKKDDQGSKIKTDDLVQNIEGDQYQEISNKQTSDQQQSGTLPKDQCAPLTGERPADKGVMFNIENISLSGVKFSGNEKVAKLLSKLLGGKSEDFEKNLEEAFQEHAQEVGKQILDEMAETDLSADSKNEIDKPADEKKEAEDKEDKKKEQKEPELIAPEVEELYRKVKKEVYKQKKMDIPEELLSDDEKKEREEDEKRRAEEKKREEEIYSHIIKEETRIREAAQKELEELKEQINNENKDSSDETTSHTENQNINKNVTETVTHIDKQGAPSDHITENIQHSDTSDLSSSQSTQNIVNNQNLMEGQQKQMGEMPDNVMQKGSESVQQVNNYFGGGGSGGVGGGQHDILHEYHGTEDLQVEEPEIEKHSGIMDKDLERIYKKKQQKKRDQQIADELAQTEETAVEQEQPEEKTAPKEKESPGSGMAKLDQDGTLKIEQIPPSQKIEKVKSLNLTYNFRNVFYNKFYLRYSDMFNEAAKLVREKKLDEAMEYYNVLLDQKLPETMKIMIQQNVLDLKETIINTFKYADTIVKMDESGKLVRLDDIHTIKVIDSGIKGKTDVYFRE